MKTLELTPLNRKSFYGKAVMLQENNVTQLKSYDTIVAKYNHATNEMEVFGWFSATTARHINAFLDYFGFDICTKNELNNYKTI